MFSTRCLGSLVALIVLSCAVMGQDAGLERAMKLRGIVECMGRSRSGLASNPIVPLVKAARLHIVVDEAGRSRRCLELRLVESDSSISGR